MTTPSVGMNLLVMSPSTSGVILFERESFKIRLNMLGPVQMNGQTGGSFLGRDRIRSCFLLRDARTGGDKPRPYKPCWDTRKKDGNRPRLMNISLFWEPKGNPPHPDTYMCFREKCRGGVYPRPQTLISMDASARSASRCASPPVDGC